MAQSNPHFRLVLVVTSNTALLTVDGISCVLRALLPLQEIWPRSPLSICTDKRNASEIHDLLTRRLIAHEILLCDVGSAQSIAQVLSSEIDEDEILVIHDASRPLTTAIECQGLLAAFTSEIDAIRPVTFFTETLKFVGIDNVIEETLDRSAIKRVSTPQIVRVSAIDKNEQNSSWFVPLKKSAHIRQIDSNSDEVRINSKDERDLLESVLHLVESVSGDD